MLDRIKKDNKGFTIIEVLIVLAIAGLIILIVFLAVPALQRNSRNTGRRNDVSTYLGAVNEFIANNNGRLPVAADLTTADSGVNALANTSSTMVEPTTLVANAQTGAVALDTIQLVVNAKCGTGGATVTATGRAFAVRYSVESSSGTPIPQCQEG